jgi:hypothetical protein
MSKTLADTVNIEKIIVPWAFNAAGGFWSRTASCVYPNGTHLRLDTIWFKDANGSAIDTVTIANVASYRHVRIVADSMKHTWNFHYDMSVTINKNPGDTEIVHNGTATGQFNGTAFRTTTITNVTRQWLGSTHPHLQFPSAGTITIDGLLRTFTIQFNGNGTAVATVVRLSDSKTTVFNINISTGVESAR